MLLRRKAFDESFRKLASQLVAQIDGGKDLAPLPADDPLFTGKVAQPLGEVHLRKILADELGRPTLDRPLILAATAHGRPIILYSPYDWTCGLEHDNAFGCRGYEDEDAARIGLTLLLYAVSY